MIFKAVVIDNADLFTRGTIRVRIAGHYMRRIIWNLEENFPKAIEEGNKEGDEVYSNDFDAVLAAPFGGGRNYGGLYVPQINEKGIVSFLGGSKKKPVWLGGLYEPFRAENFDIDYVNIPNDNFVEGTRTDGVINGESVIGDEIESKEEKSFIFRTKHTNKESAENLDWQQRDTSNIISIGKQRIRVTHFPEESWVVNEDKSSESDIVKDYTHYQDFLIGKDENGEETFRYEDRVIPLEDGDEDSFRRLEINQSKIELLSEQKVEDKISSVGLNFSTEGIGEISVVQEDVKTHSISLNEADITINKTNIDEDKITTITMGEESLSLKVIGSDEVSIDVAGTDVTITTPDVTFSISGDTVTVTAANFHFDGDAFKIAGGGDSVSLYTPLEKILDKLLNHIHVAPSGPTTPAMESNNTPLSALKADLMKIESKSSKTD